MSYLGNRKNPDFIAKLKYRTTEQGGRMSYAASGYRPHVKFPWSNAMTSGEQIFMDRKKVYPGDTVKAWITILDHVTFKNSLIVGQEFEFREGFRTIGTGEILEILNSDLQKS